MPSAIHVVQSLAEHESIVVTALLMFLPVTAIIFVAERVDETLSRPGQSSLFVTSPVQFHRQFLQNNPIENDIREWPVETVLGKLGSRGNYQEHKRRLCQRIAEEMGVQPSQWSVSSGRVCEQNGQNERQHDPSSL